MAPPDANRPAAPCEACAWLQRQARSELLQRLQFFALDPRCVLDLGAGTCQGTLELARRFRHARTIAIDLAPQLLSQAPRSLWRRRRYARVCANAYALPLADAGCDLIFSNLMLPWCERLEPLFPELRRVLRPGGLLLFSSFAPGTPQELRAAWGSVNAGPQAPEFADLPQLTDALMRAGFVEPVIDVERHRRAAFEHVRGASGLPVSWELLFGAAFAASLSGPSVARTTARGDEQIIPLDQLRRARGAPPTEIKP